MASNDRLARSPLDLLPSPPSPPPSSLPSQTHSTTSSSAPSRPIPIEIYNHILHFAFGRHLPPLSLANRLDEPPSLSPLLPLTLVSKGLRELALPFFYYHLVVRRGEDWIQLFDPTDGILVGEGEEATRRRGWIKRLSFPRDHFPVSSWTASKDLPAGTMDSKPDPIMAPLDFASLGGLEEICIGEWGRKEVVEREIEAAVNVEMAGGPHLEEMVLEGLGSVTPRWISVQLDMIRSERQLSSTLHLLFETEPSLVHLSLDPFFLEPFYARSGPGLAPKPLSLILHPLQNTDLDSDEDHHQGLWLSLTALADAFPSSKFNMDLVLESLLEVTRKVLLACFLAEGWTKDEDGRWSWVDPLTR